MESKNSVKYAGHRARFIHVLSDTYETYLNGTTASGLSLICANTLLLNQNPLPEKRKRECNMLIGGIQGISLIDYPGKVSAALFTIGCNMRCGYCHNPELVLPERFAQAIDLDEIFDFLHSRRGKLDGVVISGGEPTVQPDLEEFIAKIKSLGFLVKLDTQGTAPATIDSLIKKELIDFIAMDIKGPLHKYAQIAARPVDISAIQQSINIILSSGIDHEFRTTIVREQLSPQDIDDIGQLIHGGKRFALQKFKAGYTINPQFSRRHTYTDEEFEEFKKVLEKYVDECVVH